MYECDPKLNKDCIKTKCFIYGGNCNQTSFKEFSKKTESEEKMDEKTESKGSENKL